jgi:RNA polymerase primary sigma factor
MSMENIVSNDNRELGEFIKSDDQEENTPENQVFYRMLKEKIESILVDLNEKEQLVIQYRFGLNDGIPRTLGEIGDILGITRERVRQIEEKALIKLKAHERKNEIKDYYDE